MAKIVYHSALQWNVLPTRDHQNASSKIATRQPTPSACHTNLAKGQAKIWYEQSSTAPAHKGHSMRESGTMRCHKDLVIRHHLRKSQANTLIFRRRQHFHTNQHRYKKSRSFEFSWSKKSRYAARVVKRGPLHTHASWAASDGRRSARSSCKLRISIARVTFSSVSLIIMYFFISCSQ